MLQFTHTLGQVPDSFVQSGCTAAFEYGAVGDIQALVEATAVLLDAVQRAAPMLRETIRPRLVALADVQAQIERYRNDVPGKMLAERTQIQPLLCDAVTAANTYATASQNVDVQHLHVEFLNVIDTLREPMLDTTDPTSSLRPKPTNWAALGLITVGGLLVGLGAGTYYFRGRF